MSICSRTTIHDNNVSTLQKEFNYIRRAICNLGSGGGGGAVDSVFGRTGVVTATSGDYTAAQVTNAVDSTGSYANPSWITSLAYAKITGAPAAGANTALSNLASVAINTSLLPAVTETIDLGSSSKQWANLYMGDVGSIIFPNGGDKIYAYPGFAQIYIQSSVISLGGNPATTAQFQIQGGLGEMVVNSVIPGVTSMPLRITASGQPITLQSGSVYVADVNSTAVASAQLEIVSTTKGFLPPRMTKAQRNAISSPATGLVVWQTDNTPGLRSYNGTNWVRYTETIDA